MPPAVVLHPSRVSGLFVSGSTLQLVKLGQVIKVEAPKPETSSDEEGLTFEPEDYKLAPLAIPKLSGKKINRTNVTISEMVQSEILAPGTDVLTLNYKGRVWTASLGEQGTIEMSDGSTFGTATAFSMHCKRQATPGKQGDDGWKSVLYNGTPLDTYRARYLRLAKSHAEGGTPSVQEVAEGEGADTTAKEVQCERCKTWRTVPDEHWEAVEADERENWLCEYADWNVAALPPHKPACSRTGS